MQQHDIPEKLLKPYNPEETEQRIYKLWEDSRLFQPEAGPPWADNPDNNPNYGKSFSIMMPPPNVTGVLHLGHAFEHSLQDAIVRYKRMAGYKTLWLPGTDHAAIATQAKVETDIKKKEGKSRHDLGREEMLKRIEAYAKQSHDGIVEQIKTLGSSCDWSREAFTLDGQRNVAVNTMFKKMYEDGLIYRGNRVVNWDPKGQTTISDDEMVYEPRKATMYTFKYDKDFPISISTTRPETKLGDTAVAVHPDDSRYSKYVGQTFTVADFCGEKLEIKIIADKDVDKDFGTGALGVTPAHSTIDWEMAQRHDLPIKQVINEFAKMTVGIVKDKKTTEAREMVVEKLRELGLLEKEEEVDQNVATAERTGGIVEPLPKLQWFITVNKEIPGRGKTLKQIMREPLENGEINIIPDYFSKTYFHWIENLRDWCISRQIWYGHQVPVFYCSKKLEQISNFKFQISNSDQYFVVELAKPIKCPICGECEMQQDPDTLDTWFSSGLWTFSTLGWPHYAETATRGKPGPQNDLANFHPTSLIAPGYEILFFWVARMILMSGYALNQIPFKTIYLHGIVRDKNGKKFSKSAGNNIDPITIIKEFGADALRMSMVIGVTPGGDSKFDTNKVKAYKLFANKLWNIARFIIGSTGMEVLKKPKTLSDSDTKILQEFEPFFEDVTKELDEYHFHLAAEKLYQYVWHTFADIIIEESKTILSGEDKDAFSSRAWLLQELLRRILKGLHPFMPFVTEELWSLIPKESNQLLITTSWYSEIIQKQ